jgi:hypothetical protein
VTKTVLKRDDLEQKTARVAMVLSQKLAKT